MKPKVHELSSSPEVQSSVELVTPHEAEGILNGSSRNRRISPSVVNRYASAMRRGQWHVGQPITLDHMGRLIDGQHRLSAVVQVGRPIEFLVVRGVRSGAFDVFDIGRKRSASDVLQILGFPNYTALASASRLLLMFEIGSTSHPGVPGNPGTITVQDIVDRAKRDERLRAAAALANGKYKEATRLMRSGGMAATVLYLLETADQEAAHEFFRGLCGSSINNTEHPAWMLKMKLSGHIDRVRLSGANRRLSPSEISGLTVKAWNQFYTRRPVKQLKYALFTENPPRIAGYPYPAED